MLHFSSIAPSRFAFPEPSARAHQHFKRFRTIFESTLFRVRSKCVREVLEFIVASSCKFMESDVRMHKVIQCHFVVMLPENFGRECVDNPASLLFPPPTLSILYQRASWLFGRAFLVVCFETCRIWALCSPSQRNCVARKKEKKQRASPVHLRAR